MTANALPLSVVVVEDERDLREEVVDFLLTEGMVVRAAANGAELDRLMSDAGVDVVVLDLGLPNEDGTAIAARLRAGPERVGIVMMTARGRIEERVFGYESGADIYLVKPVDYRELTAAILAVRRTRTASTPAVANQQPYTWLLDLSAWRLVAPSGASLRLTRSEMQLLDCLTVRPGEPVSRDVIGALMGKVFNLGEHRYLDQVVSRLRRKVASELGWEAPIGSAHSQGYYFVGPVVRGGQPGSRVER